MTIAIVEHLGRRLQFGVGRLGNPQRLATVIFATLEAAWRAAWLLAPIVPNASARVRDELGSCDAPGVSSDGGRLSWKQLPAGAIAKLGPPLFPKLRPTVRR